MNRDELIVKIKSIAKQALANRKKTEIAAVEYDELTKFPELKKAIVDLLTPDFDYFLASIDWVAPKPTTFRINLKNGTSFYLIFSPRSWIAQVEGKKYYLLNLNVLKLLLKPHLLKHLLKKKHPNPQLNYGPIR